MHFTEFVAMVKATSVKHQVGRVIDLPEGEFTMHSITARTEQRGICCEVFLDINGNLSSGEFAARCMFNVVPSIDKPVSAGAYEKLCGQSSGTEKAMLGL